MLSRFENLHKTKVESGNIFLRLNDQGKTYLKEVDLISEVEFLTEIARRICGDTPVDRRKPQDTKDIWELIA